MKKNYSKWFLTRVKRAIKDYEMINRGDRITVGVSGGKDSTFRLFVLAELRRQLQLDFALQPVALELGLDLDWSPLNLSAGSLIYLSPCGSYPHLRNSLPGPAEPNPCSLCAKLRRGALHQAACT